jgi:hypothetical protein
MFILSVGVGDIIDYGNKLTVSAILILIVIGSFKGWWVAGPTHKRVLDELEKCRKTLEGRRHKM